MKAQPQVEPLDRKTEGFEVAGELREMLVRGHDEILFRKTRGTWTEFCEGQRNAG